MRGISMAVRGLPHHSRGFEVPQNMQFEKEGYAKGRLSQPQVKKKYLLFWNSIIYLGNCQEMCRLQACQTAGLSNMLDGIATKENVGRAIV